MNKAILAVVLCGCIAGSSGIFIKLMTSFDASSIAFLRMAVPALFLAVWIKLKEIKFFRGNVKRMLLASCLNAVRMYFFFIAYTYTSIGNAVILCYTWPLFVVLFSGIFLKEKLSRQQLSLILLAFLGLVIAYSNKPLSFQDRDFVGMMAAVTNAMLYALTVIIYKSESDNYTRNELIFYQNFIGAFVFLPFFFIQFSSLQLGHLGLGVGYAFLIGIIGFNLFFYGLKYLKASVASSIMYLEIVSAILFSWLFLQELITFTMAIGGGMILLSSYLISRK